MRPTVGFALCGSFCTFRKAIDALRALTAQYTVVPIFSDAAWETDTRFGASAGFRAEVTALCGTEPLHTLAQVEPLGPKRRAGQSDRQARQPCGTFFPAAGGGRGSAAG